MSESQRRWVLVSIVLALLTALISCTLCRNAINSAIRSYLTIDGQIDKVDALVVLAGDLKYRTLAAAELYQRGYADKIILTKRRSFQQLVAKVPEEPVQH